MVMRALVRHARVPLTIGGSPRAADVDARGDAVGSQSVVFGRVSAPGIPNRAMRSVRVGYLCVQRTHSPALIAPGAGLVSYAGEWGYCPAAASANHYWLETGGIEIIGLTPSGAAEASDRTAQAAGSAD